MPVDRWPEKHMSLGKNRGVLLLFIAGKKKRAQEGHDFRDKIL